MTYEEFIKTQIRNRNNWTDDDPGSDKFSYTVRIGDSALTKGRGSGPHRTIEQAMEMTVGDFDHHMNKRPLGMWKIFLERITPLWRDYQISQLGI